uniref:Uncharacterized protein n=1 Tax=Thermodesulfobium narugense TaxID=184064 RepID=A0A7C5PA26_9BACT
MAIYPSPFVKDEGETVLPFAREAGRIIYTNLGNVKEADELYIKAGKEEYFKAETIIESYHNGGNDGLVNRGIERRNFLLRDFFQIRYSTTQ